MTDKEGKTFDRVVFLANASILFQSRSNWLHQISPILCMSNSMAIHLSTFWYPIHHAPKIPNSPIVGIDHNNERSHLCQSYNILHQYIEDSWPHALKIWNFWFEMTVHVYRSDKELKCWKQVSHFTCSPKFSLT